MFAAAGSAADVAVTLEIWPHMIYAWHLWNARLEAQGVPSHAPAHLSARICDMGAFRVIRVGRPMSSVCRLHPCARTARVGKDFLRQRGLVGAPCVRPVFAVHMTASHNALRGNLVLHLGCQLGLLHLGPPPRRSALYQGGPAWRDHLLFNEYFDGDTGEGLAASHQTGWTALAGAFSRTDAARGRRLSELSIAPETSTALPGEPEPPHLLRLAAAGRPWNSPGVTPVTVQDCSA